MAQTYQQLLDAIGQRESGGRYNIKNSIGYLGKYQLGEAALIDAGYYKKDSTSKNDWAGTWTGKDGITSVDGFLANSTAQENAIQAYMTRQWGYIKRRWIPTKTASSAALS